MTDVSPMQPVSTLVRRKQWLTHEPAEFVENGALFRALIELAESTEELEDLGDLENTSEYAPDLDRFVPKDTVINASRYYQESKKRKLAFQQRLEGFACMLKERNVDQELRIQIKDPKDFDLAYVLDLIDKIEKHRDKKRPYRAFFRKCFRKIEDNKVVIEGILSFVPDDVYGSLISGGFTLILASIEKHTKEREATETFLTEIQDRLGGIQRLNHIHRSSHRVHSYADAVLVSVFTVLERIMDKITKSWQASFLEPLKGFGNDVKNLFRGDNRTKLCEERNAIATTSPESNTETETGKIQSVPDALAALQRCIEQFQNEIDLATKEMIASIDQKVSSTNTNVKYLSRAFVWMAKNVGAAMKRNEEDFFIRAQDALCLVLKSDSFINHRTAQVDYKEMEQNRLEQAAQSKRRLHEKNSRVTSKWLSGLRGFDYDSITDIRDCIEHMEQLDGNAKNVSERIITSEELNDWLQDEQSSILMVDIQTPPSELSNPLSFTSALLAMSLRSTEKFPVLAYFCMHRNNEFPDEAESGPLAMIKSLNGQLLEFMNKNRPDSNLSRLEAEDFFSKSKKKLEHGVSLLQALLSLLPDNDNVFIIIDSLSRLSGKETDGHKLVRALKRIMRSQKRIHIRILATDPLVDSPLRNIAQWQLHMPDFVSGADTMDFDDNTRQIRKRLGDIHGKGHIDGVEEDDNNDNESDEEEEAADDHDDNDEDDDSDDDHDDWSIH
ncbi:hypothetical protein NUW58_g3737 [Xylaria curta]|uniref:Uncharacterized protein n=1 Tax=Xylaria curta TaxID=42375 RepID=A0ACC1PAI3_9PEZI|nr:hypothetical protein NUW58_g3737 [Xylaria curta]